MANTLIFFAEKMWVAFTVQKLLTFLQQKKRKKKKKEKKNNVSENTLATTVNKFVINKLVKLTMHNWALVFCTSVLLKRDLL